jgi:hypothetical protein
MKYYQNKITKEIIGTTNMRTVIKEPTEQSIKMGITGYSYEVVYDMITPNKILGNGIVSYCITWKYLNKNYKRIKREIALEKHPDFRQYRHADMVIEAEVNGVEGLEILTKQTF